MAEAVTNEAPHESLMSFRGEFRAEVAQRDRTGRSMPETTRSQTELFLFTGRNRQEVEDKLTRFIEVMKDAAKQIETD